MDGCVSGLDESPCAYCDKNLAAIYMSDTSGDVDAR